MQQLQWLNAQFLLVLLRSENRLLGNTKMRVVTSTVFNFCDGVQARLCDNVDSSELNIYPLEDR
jgi:hypothetical protein